jgi:Spy/CpxP family protein refolding chaperone
MRTLCKLTLILTAAALLVGSAQAQRPGGGFGRGGGIGMLLMNKSVQDELKLTDEQKDKIKTAMEKVREDQKDAFATLRDRQAKEEDRNEARKKVTEATTKALDGILTKDQDKRVKQIQLQQEGPRAFVNPDVQSALKLSDDQKDKIKTIVEDTGKETREAFQGIGMDREKFQAAMKKVQELNKEATEKITSLLKDDQKKTLKDLLGEKFEIKFEGRPGGGQRRNNRQAQPEKKTDF